MRRVLLALLLVLLGAWPASAQSGIFTRAAGSITAGGTDCTVAAQCVILTDATRTANGTIVITGTWVGTVQFEGTLLDMTVATNVTGTGWFALNVLANGSNAFVTSATANGQWTVPMALTGLRARASAFTSGTITVGMAVTSAQIRRGPGIDGTTIYPTIVCEDNTNRDTGLARVSAGLYKVTDCSTTNYAILGTGGGRLQAAGVLGWSSSTDATAAADTGWSRTGAGILGVGTGAQGSIAGTLAAARLTTTGTGTYAGLTLASGETVGVLSGAALAFSSGDPFFSNAAALTDSATSGSGRYLHLTETIAPAAGSRSFALVSLLPTINVSGAQTGTYYLYGGSVIETALNGLTVNLIDVGTTTSTLFSGYTSKFKVTDAGLAQPTLYGSQTNCSSTAAPAVCAAAPAGSVVIAAAATSVVVNTTAVTANSQIFAMIDRSLGTRLSVTCDTTSDLTTGSPAITERTAATSFTVAVPVAPAVNPMCLSYFIVN